MYLENISYLNMDHPQNHRLILPYLSKTYDYGEYKYDSHSVSPDNKYIAIYLTITESDGDNPFAEPNAASSVLKLFKISNNEPEPHLAFCTDLLTFDCIIDNFSFIWSASGNKLICEYQINSAEPYKLIYFDITDDKYDNYKVHYVFADNNTYKWEHSMSFSPNDSILVTVYNREIIRIFEYSAETCNYHFKTEEKYDSNTYTVTNIYLTEDNKLIVSLYNSVDIKNIVVSYQISEDKSELHYLTEYGITSLAGTHIFNSSKCTHNNNDYLVLLVTSGINYHSPSKIYIYDLTELKIAEVIDITSQFGGYMVNAHKMLFGTMNKAESLLYNEEQKTTLPKLCYPITAKQTNLVNGKYIWVSSGPQDEICKYMFNVFTKEKIFTAYSSHEYTGIQNINGRLSHQYNQLYKTSNKVYTVCTGLQSQCNATGVTQILRLPFSLATPAKREPVALKVQRHAGNTNVLPEQNGVGLEFSVSGTFTNVEQDPYKAMYNLNKGSQFAPIEDIKFIHNTTTYVICEYDNKLWVGHSLPFCEEKNTVTITNLLHEYIPVELCHLVAKYCV